MKNLEDVNKEIAYFTGKVGETSRQLAFAGVGIVWIFKIQNNNGPISISPDLYFVLKYFVLFIIADVAHYIVPSIIFFFYFLYQENIKHKSDVDPINPSIMLVLPTYILLVTKVVFLIIAYIDLYNFIIKQISIK